MTHNEQEDAAVAALFSKVGPRLLPPGPTREAVYFSTLSAWRRETDRRRWQRRIVALAAGLACVATGVVILQFQQLARDPAPPVADIVGEPPPGVALEASGAEGMLLPAPGGELMRLRPGTRYAMRGEQFWLLEGAVYVEAHRVGAKTSLLIHAGGVRVRHVGTRYAVSVEAGSVDVRVRDGQVEVATAVGRERAGSGTLISVASDGGRMNRGSVPIWGSSWIWAEELAPPMAIDGRVLSRVLEDIAFETGRRLEFESEAVRRMCEATRLKGPVLEIPASGRLFAVLVATGLEAVENGERIVIRQQTE